ncbi:MAG: Caffeine dehydrogenase subunit beta [Firmicutes bacterium ADurb.Bin182]|nr:MAG: Caffeine dehydrogenase subunit beta [Firmicutes bacterium ADurb.Bin182]
MNTMIIEQEFEYVKPGSLFEALDILAQTNNVKIYAGGTDLIVKLKTSGINMDAMMDINGIPELSELTASGGNGLVIGSAVKLSRIEKHPAVKSNYSALFEALMSMASVSVRNMGTLGGNLANASPAADTAGPVICYKGILELMSRSGIREVPAEDFFISSGVSAIRPDELLTRIKLPAVNKNTGAKFIKTGRVKSDIAKVSFTVVIEREGSKIKSCRAAAGSAAAKPVYLRTVSESLKGRIMTRELITETVDRIAGIIEPIDDQRTTAEYRKELIKVIAADAFSKAWSLSGGKLI